MIFGEISLFFNLSSSIGGSIGNKSLCTISWQLSTAFFYLNFLSMLYFETKILNNCFETASLPEIVKYGYPKHIFTILSILLFVLSISIFAEIFCIGSFTSPLSDIGCQWKLSSTDSSSSLLIVIWSWFNGLCLFFIIWLLLGMYGYKCFQFKSQYKLSIMYNKNINLSTKTNIKTIDNINIDNIHEYKTIVNDIYYLLQKISLLMIITEFTGFIVIISILITWIHTISQLFIYFVFTMTVLQIIINSYAVTLMLDDNNFLFQGFAYCFRSCFKCLYSHLYHIIDENIENQQQQQQQTEF